MLATLEQNPALLTKADTRQPQHLLVVLPTSEGIEKLARVPFLSALQTALKDPNIKTRFAELGTEPVPAEQATPDALRNKLKSQIDVWTPIIKKAGVYAD